MVSSRPATIRDGWMVMVRHLRRRAVASGSGAMTRSAVWPVWRATAAKKAARRFDTIRASLHVQPATRQAPLRLGDDEASASPVRIWFGWNTTPDSFPRSHRSEPDVRNVGGGTRRAASACDPAPGWTDVHRGAAKGQPGARLQPALERLEIERGGPPGLWRDHRLEHPEAQRQPDPDRPAQARRLLVGGHDGIDLDRDALAILAAQPEGGARHEDRDAAVEDRRAAGHGLRDPQPRAGRQRTGIEPLDADDARGDEPVRVALDVGQRGEDLGRRPADARLDLDRDRHRPARRQRPEPERRSVAEAFGRRPVAQDQAADRPSVIGRRERFGERVEGPVARSDVAGRIGEQVRRPGRVDRSGRDEERAGRELIVDEPDGHRACLAAASAARLDPDETTGGDELVLHRPPIGRRQRPRCQDLPSVWVDGA